MSEVTALHRCGRCGSALGEPAFCRTKGGEILRFFSCPGCLGQTASELFRVKSIFEAMLDADVPRDIADDTMTFLLKRLHP
jgi:hypothetical protein